MREKSDIIFETALTESEGAVEYICKWLGMKGYKTVRHPVKVRPDHRLWRMYSDNGDFDLIEGDTKYRMEVKKREFIFSCKSDYKFSDVFVCSKHSYDMASVNPRYFFIVSQDFRAVAIIDVIQTRDHWKVNKKVRDSRYGDEVFEQDVYSCPKDLAAWKILPGRNWDAY